jgi:hypothetical protein
MPRPQTPVVYVAMTANMLARSMCLRSEVVHEAVLRGELEARQYPGSSKKLIWLADAERWYRGAHWRPARKSKRTNEVPNAR